MSLHWKCSTLKKLFGVEHSIDNISLIKREFKKETLKQPHLFNNSIENFDIRKLKFNNGIQMNNVNIRVFFSQFEY